MKNNQHARVQDKLLWAATVMNKTFVERIEACIAGGYNQMSVFPIDIKMWEDKGNTIDELNTMCKEANVRITILDPFTKWLPNWKAPKDASNEDIAFADFEEDDFFRMARALGVNRINLVESYTPRATIEVLAENFKRICNRAATLGITVGTEFMPFAPTINNLDITWEFVSKAAVDNGGLVLDTWHFYRAESDIETLKKIPVNKIVALQLADADYEIKGDNLMEDLLKYRKAPGDGEFPLKEVLDVLLENDYLKEIGVEIFADEYKNQEAKTNGLKSSKAIDNLFAKNNYIIKNQDILTLHRQFCRAIWRGDKVYSTNLIAQDFKGVSHFGSIVDKEKYIDVHFNKEFTRFDAIVKNIIREGSLAILTGHMVLDDKEKELPSQNIFSAIYKKNENGNWLLHYWQDTKIEFRD